MSEQDSYIYGTVKVGDRGQIVILSKARKELNIKSGDLLLVMAGKNRRGLALVKAEMMLQRIMKVNNFGVLLKKIRKKL